MPTPARTSLDEIVAAARAILEAGGLDGLTMAGVAAAVGVRGPSLYKRVADRGALIHLVATAVADELGGRIRAAATTGEPARDLRAMLDAYRAFAHEQPAGNALLFDRIPEPWRIDAETSQYAIEPLFAVVAALAGPDRRLEAARLLVAWIRGFVSMELAGAFRYGGSVDDAFDYGVDHLIAAISLDRDAR